MVANLETLEVAIQHHRSGELDQAERLYNELLRIDPQHADALHLVGVLVHQRNRNQESVDYISRAISVNNNVSLYHSNLGASYRELGEIDRAVECFQNAIRLDPHFAGAHYNLGMEREASGQTKKAVACYQEASNIIRTSSQHSIILANSMPPKNSLNKLLSAFVRRHN